MWYHCYFHFINNEKYLLLLGKAVRFDGFVTAIHEGKRYANVTYELKDGEGNTSIEKGAYLIVDGGWENYVKLCYINLRYDDIISS